MKTYKISSFKYMVVEKKIILFLCYQGDDKPVCSRILPVFTGFYLKRAESQQAYTELLVL
ncbi:MAG: hypothetical protein Ct9H300mP28_27460 [Pseudomonadota bacterium]|nr:MAG: hypothetical protein Ct9H300mP28_27460 [Pseudomonadota bacterium]